jgi:comEA protein
MPDIWNKLDDLLYEYRWIIVVALVAVTLIGGGIFLLNHPESTAGWSTPQTSIVEREEPVEQRTSAPEVSGPININSASKQELESLPGIGPALAQRIIDWRENNGPFMTVEDIQKVKGIGPKIFADIKDKIAVE